MQKEISRQSAIEFDLAAIREENAKLRREITQLQEARSSIIVADDLAQRYCIIHTGLKNMLRYRNQKVL